VRSRATPRFWAAYRDLPAEIREAARKAYRLFREANLLKVEDESAERPGSGAVTSEASRGRLQPEFNLDGAPLHIGTVRRRTST
jgi:hypothetical protein